MIQGRVVFVPRIAVIVSLALLLAAAPWARRVVLVASAAEIAKPPAQVVAAERERIAAVAKSSRSTVCVFDPAGQGGGAGVVITPDGYCLTNFHVVQPCGNHMKCGLNDGVLYDAVLVSIDPTGDVAMIKLLGREDFPTAEFGDSDAVAVGDWCFAIGNPFLLATDLSPTVSYGIVSGTHRYQYPSGTLLEYADCIQTDAAINPGNSGGPLFNAAGQLIGINGRGSFEKRGRVNVGVGYAISINQIKKFMGQLRSGRIVDHATLGANVSTDDEGRVVVTNILESSDAYRRGLRYGDEIVSFGGRTLGSVNAFKNVLGTFPKGWRVPLSYRRQNERFDIQVRLAGVHRAEELAEKIGEQEEGKENPHKDKEAPKEKQQEPDDEEKKPAEKAPPAPGRKPGKQPAGKKLPSKAPVPDHVAKLYQAKSGYANYYFNLLERARVWRKFAALSKYEGLSPNWSFVGQMNGGAHFEVAFQENRVTGTWGEQAFAIDTEKDLDQQLAPQGSGGMLAALYLWQRLALRGTEKFGEVVYQGTAPLPGSDALYDVFVATHGVVETRFYFEPNRGDLVAMEMFPDGDVDPCELIFGDWKDVANCRMPHQIEVRHANGQFGVVKVNEWKLPAAKEKSS